MFSLLSACDPPEAAPVEVPEEEASPLLATADEGARPWAEELAELDRLITAQEARMAASPESWKEAEELAAHLQARARLTGDLGDYARAEAALAEGFSRAPAGGGPLLQRARLHYTLHRLDAAEADLDAIDAQPIRTATAEQAVADMRADIALERGQLDAAERHWRAAEEARPSMKSAAALGKIAWTRGHFEAADHRFAEALKRYHAAPQEPVAWGLLQRGLLDLDRGDAAAALAHYREAEAAMPGYWLVDEHIAEAMVLTGQTLDALALYRDVVERTGSPELQGALAELLVSAGDEEEARALIAAADATYAEQLARFPEAASGHALEHALTWGTDPATALALAEKNAALRPNGEALALLSEARLKSGDTAGARAAAEAALATGARSASIHLAAAAAARAAGDAAAAEGQLAHAKAIDASAAP